MVHNVKSFWSLEIGAWDLFGIWDFDIEI